MTEQLKNQVYLFSRNAALQQSEYGKIKLKDGTEFLFTDHMYYVPVEHAVDRYKKYFSDIEVLNIPLSSDIVERIYPINLSAQKRIEFSDIAFNQEQDFLFYSEKEAEIHGSIIMRTYDGKIYEYTVSFNSGNSISEHPIYNDRVFVKIINRNNIAHQEAREMNLLSRVKSMFKKK